MDHTAVDSIAQLAIESANARHLDTFIPAVILDQDGKQIIVSIEHLQKNRSRYRGVFVTASIADFAAYAVQQHEAGNAQVQGFIDTDGMSAKVFFNLGDAGEPGHGDHHASLKLKPTAAYSALCRAVQCQHSQRTLHDFVEDWRDNIVALYDGQATDKPLASTLAAVRDITIETARSVTNIDRDMGATMSAMESVDAKSRLTLPSGFQFRCVPYEGLAERTFNLRLGVNTGGDKIALGLRIQQAEAVTEAIANNFRDVLGAKLGTASTLTLGTFAP